MEYRDPYRGDRIELGEARQEHDQCELYAGGRWRLLRLRPDQEESRHRIEFPRAGLIASLSCHCGERSDRSNPMVVSKRWIASLSLSSGAHSPDPLARNDGSLCLALSGDDLIDLRQQLPPRLVDFRRPVDPEYLAQRIRDHAEKF